MSKSQYKREKARSTRERTKNAPKLLTEEGDRIIRELYTCPVCHDLLYIPTELVPCGHLMCLSCINGYIATAAHGGCPVCRVQSSASRRVPILVSTLEKLFPEEMAKRSLDDYIDEELKKAKVEQEARLKREMHQKLQEVLKQNLDMLARRTVSSADSHYRVVESDYTPHRRGPELVPIGTLARRTARVNRSHYISPEYVVPPEDDEEIIERDYTPEIRHVYTEEQDDGTEVYVDPNIQTEINAAMSSILLNDIEDGDTAPVENNLSHNTHTCHLTLQQDITPTHLHRRGVRAHRV